VKEKTYKVKPSEDNTIYLPQDWIDELKWDENEKIVIMECFHESDSDKMISELTLTRERDLELIFPDEVEKSAEQVQQEKDFEDSFRAGLFDKEAEA
tara:strand:- start:29 stop:319 length:291 start_codon:yes stop_codon:yes gene_type:complete